MATSLRSFKVLSPQVYYLPTAQPPTTTPNSHETADSEATSALAQDTGPELILLFTWMGALPKHIVKYTTAYATMFPTAAMLVVRTSVTDMMFRPSISLRARLLPALDTVLSSIANANAHNRRPRILAQAFSNGGTFALLTLAKEYAQRTGGLKPLPVTAAIFDSGPGKGHYARSVHAIMVSVPYKSAFIRLPILAAVHLALTLMKFLNRFRGVESVITSTYRETNMGLNPTATSDDSSSMQALGKSIPRLYLFSEADAMVDWRDVQAHADAARDSGVKHVETVRFKDSAHVNHLRVEPGRYLDAVKKIWEVGVEMGGGLEG